MRLANSAAEGMYLLGDAVSGLAFNMKLRQDDAFLTDFEVQLAKGSTQLLSDMSQAKFTDLVSADGRKQGAEKIDGYFQKLKDNADQVGQGNPRLGAAMKDRIARGEVHAAGTYQRIENEKFRDYDRSMAQEALALDSESYMNAPDDTARMGVLTRGMERINARRGTTFSEQEAVDIKQKWATKTHVDYIEYRLKATPEIASGSPEQAGKMIADLTDPLKYPFLGVAAKNHILQQFEAARHKLVLNGAYADAANTWKDPAQARVAVLDPANIQKWGITVGEAAQMSNIFNALDNERKQAEKDRQEKNLDAIFAVAIKSPSKALGLIKDAQDVDPKNALSLQRSIESHIRSMSLMSAQEKATVRDYEDKVKTGLKADILAGKYRDERAITSAVIASGVTNSSAFLDDALGTFRNYKKDAGAINFFKEAEQDWDRMISTTKSVKRKRELQDMKPQMLETLRLEMDRGNLRVSDKKVFEIYQGIRKGKTQTWFQSAMDKAFSASRDMISGTGDSFIVEPDQGAATKTMQRVDYDVRGPMSEATARRDLEAKGIRGAEQEQWIKKYRDAGVVE